METSHNSIEQERLDALIGFVPLFESPDFQFSRWIKPPSKEDGVIVMPYFTSDKIAEDFVRTCYDKGWVLNEFDWSEWMKTNEAAQLRDDSAVLEQATPEHLGRLLTVLIRQERFVEGCLQSAFESGLLLRILQRAEVLAAHFSDECR